MAGQTLARGQNSQNTGTGARSRNSQAMSFMTHISQVNIHLRASRLSRLAPPAVEGVPKHKRSQGGFHIQAPRTDTESLRTFPFWRSVDFGGRWRLWK